MRPLHQTGRCGSSSRGTLRVVLVAFGITVLASFADGFLPVGRLPVDPVPNYRQQKCRDPSRTSALSRGRQLPFAGPWPNVPRASRFHIHLASASSAANGESQGSDGATASGTAAAHWGQLSAETRRALEAKGIEAFTPVQEASFAPIRGGRDVVARSATGTGKTLAFLVPLIEAMLAGGTPAANEGAPLCMILAPTRELAQQVHREARAIAGKRLSTALLAGGTAMEPQQKALAAGVHIAVGTPGRTVAPPPTPPHPAAPCAPSRFRAANPTAPRRPVRPIPLPRRPPRRAALQADLLRGRQLSLRRAAHLVLDEADALLDAGFSNEARPPARLPDPGPKSLSPAAIRPQPKPYRAHIAPRHAPDRQHRRGHAGGALAAPRRARPCPQRAARSAQRAAVS